MRHGGPPPPGMFHGPGMWHHMMAKPHEMCPPHKMHKMHSKFEKMHHKMHKKHHKKHHGRRSSSSSSSSESEDESLVEGIDKVQIGDEQQGKEKPGNETPATPGDGGYIGNETYKCKKGKHFKSKDKKEKCKYCSKKMHKNAFNPYWMQCSGMREPPCRDPRYNKGIFNLPPPETSSNTDEGRAETEPNGNDTPHVHFDEASGREKSKNAGQRSQKRVQRRGDSIDYFMQSIAEQIKKLPETKIAEAKLKILEVVNEMQLDIAPTQSTSGEGMIFDNQQSPEPRPEIGRAHV